MSSPYSSGVRPEKEGMITVRSFRCRAGRPEIAPVVPPSPDPVGRLLRELRTRTVTLLVDGRELTGKLVCLNPVTLASPDGQVIVVRLKAIQAVSF
jgi:hypothetical protein